MKRQKVREGDKVILTSPKYGVHGCEALVLSVTLDGIATSFKPLNAVFDHSNFRTNRRHSIESTDVYYKKENQNILSFLAFWHLRWDLRKEIPMKN